MVRSDATARLGALCALTAGVAFLVPLSFYFYFLPAAGSSATHAQDPASFLPWMAEQGGVRVALWWVTCVPFLVALLGVPNALKRRLKPSRPTAARTAELAGILGFFTLLLASLMLAAGEMPLAQAYVRASPEARPAIVAIYEWQRLVTALLFDVLGFLLLGLWVLVNSVAGLRSGRLPRWLGWFGVVTSGTVFAFVLGYVTRIGWLGELGIGASAFITLPAWLLWLGVVLWRYGGAEMDG
jgi:hypothetical protein